MSKKNILKENMTRFGTKNLVNEHVLGQLPSEKLMKMKWNPLTEVVDMNKMAQDVAKNLPRYADGIVPWSVDDPGGDMLEISRGDEVMATIKPSEYDGDRFEIRPTAAWGGARSAGPGLVIINNELPTASQTIEWVRKNFGKAEPLSIATDDSEQASLDGNEDPVYQGGELDQIDIVANPNDTGEEIYDQEPSGGFCKRNLDLLWYSKNIITGKSYLKSGDCGIAVETAQEHMNEYFESHGNGTETIDVDGAYGPKTRSAVKQVQKALDLTADGLYGKKTHSGIMLANKPAALKAKDLTTSKIDISTLPPLSPADTKEFIQTAKTRSNKNKKKRKLKLNIFKGIKKGVGKKRYKASNYTM